MSNYHRFITNTRPQTFIEKQTREFECFYGLAICGMAGRGSSNAQLKRPAGNDEAGRTIECPRLRVFYQRIFVSVQLSPATSFELKNNYSLDLFIRSGVTW